MIKQIREALEDLRTVIALLVTVVILLVLRIDDLAAAAVVFAVCYLGVFVIHRLVTINRKTPQAEVPTKKGKKGKSSASTRSKH